VVKVNNLKEYEQLVEKLQSLNEEKKTYRAKAIFNWKERKKLELSFNNIKQERDTANALLSEAKQTLLEFQEELQRKNRSREEAWKKASESSAELEVLKQQFNSLKSQLQKKSSSQRANIESQTHSDVTEKHDQTEENTKLRKALDVTLQKVSAKDLSIRKLKNQKKVLLKEKKYLKKKIYQQAKMHQVREAKHNIKLKSNKKIIDSLKDENARLLALQQETNTQFSSDSDKVIQQLSYRLMMMKTKLGKSERQAKHINRLKRERQVQESAIEILSDDLETLNKEKTLLTQERDRLIRELRELKDQHFYTQDMKGISNKKAGLSMKMLQL
jgi:hypothetical protein